MWLKVKEGIVVNNVMPFVQEQHDVHDDVKLIQLDDNTHCDTDCDDDKIGWLDIDTDMDRAAVVVVEGGGCESGLK